MRRGLTETGMKVHIEKRRTPGRTYCGRQLIAVDELPIGEEVQEGRMVAPFLDWPQVKDMCIACRRRLQEQEQRA